MKAKKAVENFTGGYNCAQAVLSAFCMEAGIEESSAASIAALFGGGVGGSGEMCGCVSGALMAIGMVKAKETIANPGNRKEAYSKAREFCSRFREKYGNLNCRDLMKTDMTSDTEYTEAKAAGTVKNRCSMFVKTAVSMAEDIINNY